MSGWLLVTKFETRVEERPQTITGYPLQAAEHSNSPSDYYFLQTPIMSFNSYAGWAAVFGPMTGRYAPLVGALVAEAEKAVEEKDIEIADLKAAHANEIAEMKARIANLEGQSLRSPRPAAIPSTSARGTRAQLDEVYVAHEAMVAQRAADDAAHGAMVGVAGDGWVRVCAIAGNSRIRSFPSATLFSSELLRP